MLHYHTVHQIIHCVGRERWDKFQFKVNGTISFSTGETFSHLLQVKLNQALVKFTLKQYKNFLNQHILQDKEISF